MKYTEHIHDVMGLGSTEKSILSSLTWAKNIQNIALETGISRTGINYCLNTLLKRGLVRIVWNNKKKLYTALSEHELVDKLQQTIDRVKTSRSGKKGVRIKTTKENEFVIHIGAGEIIPAYERIASENKNERILAIQHHRSYNELLEKISPKQLVAFNETIIKNHLIIDGMLNESAYKTYKEEIRINPRKYKDSVKSLEGRMADYTLFADNSFNHDAEL